jgi:hypothetical protein
MPGSDRAIIQSIFKMTDQHKNDNVTYVNAVVLSVDIPNRKCSCTAIDGHTEYELPTVRLMASVDDGVLIEPEIGSTIKVIFSQNIEPFAVQFSGIKNITIFASTNITIQSDSTVNLTCGLANIISDKIRLGGNKSIVVTDLPSGSPILGLDSLVAGNITGN